MEALEPKREIRRSLKRPRPADSSQNDLKDSSQASEVLATDDPICATRPGSNSSPTPITSTEAIPRVKRRRTDDELLEIVKPRSPKPISTAPINTFPYERRLNGMRHSDERHPAGESAKPKSIGHSTSDPTPLHPATPESRMSPATTDDTTRSNYLEQRVQSSLTGRGLLQRSLTEGGNKRTPKCSTVKAAQEPDGSA